LDGFESHTSQTSSHFFPIPSNPCVLGITEQALIWIGRPTMHRDERVSVQLIKTVCFMINEREPPPFRSNGSEHVTFPQQPSRHELRRRAFGHHGGAHQRAWPNDTQAPKSPKKQLHDVNALVNSTSASYQDLRHKQSLPTACDGPAVEFPHRREIPEPRATNPAKEAQGDPPCILTKLSDQFSRSPRR
jgi:hypothetical protein